MIVVDTHVLVWWVDGGTELSLHAKEAIKQEVSPAGEILISSITAWEVAMLVDKGRLSLTMNIDDWFAVVGEIEGVRFVPLDNELAIQSGAVFLFLPEYFILHKNITLLMNKEMLYSLKQQKF